MLHQLHRRIGAAARGTRHCRSYRGNSSACLSIVIAGVLSLLTCQPSSGQQPNSSHDIPASQTLRETSPGSCHFPTDAPAVQPEDGSPLTPKIFGSSVQARGGDVVFFQGANLTSRARIILESPDGGLYQLPVVNRVDDNWIAAEIPATISGSFQVRIVNELGSSAAIRINAPVPYHLDTTQLSPGAQFRIFGRNLRYGPCRPTVLVGGHAANVDLESSSDFMLVVRAPLAIGPADGAQVLVDNGGGLGPTALDGGVRIVAGSGDPLNLNVGWAALFDFGAKTIRSSAKCNGTTDDADAIRRDISTAAALGGATIQLPRGTCRLASTVDFKSRVILRGAGSDQTIIRYESNYPISAVSVDLVGLEALQLLNAGATQEGMMWRGNTRSFIRDVTINMGVSRQWFLTDNQDFVFDRNVVVQTGSYDEQNPYRFDRSAGLRFSNNRTTNVNGSPTFQHVHDSFFLNNRFTRDAISQDETKVIAHHGFVIDFSRRVSVIGNTFDVVNGPIKNALRNDGETILVEGGGPDRTESLGIVKDAGVSFFSDPDNPSIARSLSGAGAPPNLHVAIVSGAGSGQTRRIVGHDNGQIKVDPPWDIPPTAGSHYSTFVWGLEKVLIVGNTLVDNPRGIWLYQSSIRDILIRGNNIREGGGIYLRSFQGPQIFTIQLNTAIEENTITNQTGRWMSHIILVGVTADKSTFGIGQLGIEVRRNTLIANRPNRTSSQEEYAAHEGYAATVRVEAAPPLPNLPPRLIGPIFQENVCINCDRPFTVGSGVAGAVFVGNTPRRTVRDLDSLERPIGGSISTVIR